MKLIGSALVLALFLASQRTAQKGEIPYPGMASAQQYLMPRDADNLCSPPSPGRYPNNLPII